MIDANRRKAVRALHEEGMSLREIARRLHIGRGTPRRIVENPDEAVPRPRKRKVELDEDLLRKLYADCEGFIERIREKLAEEYNIPVWEDLNAQGFEWATARMEYRPQTKRGLIPAQVFEHERAVLIPVSPHLCAPYQELPRLVDQYGYVAFEGNFYWVPGTDRRDVKILQYDKRLEIHAPGQAAQSYPLPPVGTRNALFSPEGEPKPPYQPRSRRKRTEQEETRLRAMGEPVVRYLEFALPAKGHDRHAL